MNKEIYIFDSLSHSIEEGDSSVFEKVKKLLLRAAVRASDVDMAICKRSVDARRKNDIRIVCSVSVSFREGAGADREKLIALGARAASVEELCVPRGSKKMSDRPLVVGMGPAGLFCGLVLAENGYRPILIDRGDSVKDRVNAVERFYREKILDTESNIQFGAGGAGTFSDGKLLTRINDPKCTYVLETLKRFGAPEDVTVKAKPHIGTDILREVVDNILKYIESLGGDVIYRCKLEYITETLSGKVLVRTSKGEMTCSCAVLALGHSARDTYKMLIGENFSIEAKPISVGVRIEHKRRQIEEALYGNFAGHPALGAAEYALSDTKGERGVYTFCMCPGGEVVAAASEYESVVVNGMSSYARDGENSNSAVAVSVKTSDFESVDGSLALGAIEFQRNIERAAYRAGGSDYSVPVQTVGDFMQDISLHEPIYVLPTYMGGNSYNKAKMDDVLPRFVCRELRRGLSSFDKKLKGFASETALLSGAETRTSAPVRILRTEDMRAIGKLNIYPCGEGAGYAGGITSAAVDGIKTALAIASRFAPMD